MAALLPLTSSILEQDFEEPWAAGRAAAHPEAQTAVGRGSSNANCPGCPPLGGHVPEEALKVLEYAIREGQDQKPLGQTLRWARYPCHSEPDGSQCPKSRLGPPAKMHEGYVKRRDRPGWHTFLPGFYQADHAPHTAARVLTTDETGV
jgi:hypothetical protein